MRLDRTFLIFATVGLLGGCIGGNKGGASNTIPPPPTVNTLAVVVDSGPAAATGAFNTPYVTVKVCAPGSVTQCASIDHVLLDSGSWGLRLVRSVLTASAVTLTPETDAQGQTIEECANFGGGQTWGPVATADVTLAGEVAAKLPIQIMDDTLAGAPIPSTCGSGGSVQNGVGYWLANGILGVGVFAQDCGTACVSASTPQPIYYGCSTAGTCTPENVALTLQVTNPVSQFAADNNGVIIDLPALANANGDASVTGQIIFGIGTQSDNPLPATGLTSLGTDSEGHFATVYNGAPTSLPALIDSGSDSYLFDNAGDANMVVCVADPTANPPQTAKWVGFYCPTVQPESVFAINSNATGTKALTPGGSDTVNFAVDNPNTFVSTASAFINLAGGSSSTVFNWGMPFFYGRKIYVGLEAKSAGSLTGPFFAY